MPGPAFQRVFWDIIAEVSPRGRRVEPTEDGAVEDVQVAVVIEDDADIRALLADILRQAGFVVHPATTGEEGLELIREHDPIVTTLDVSMPGMDGFETAKRIRSLSSTYIVMLTARTEEIDVLQGLQSGADDYVTKPFRPRELRARIEAMLRRPRMLGAEARSGDEPDRDDGWITHRGLQVNIARHVARIDDAEVELTRSEFDILAELLEAGGRVVSKGELALSLRGDRASGGFVSEHDERAIEVHVANLRRKLGDSIAQPRWIETVRGVGYRRTSA